MSAKRRKTKLVFFLGGPQAVKGSNYWRTSIKGGHGVLGCQVAIEVGASISRDTYSHAAPKLSVVSTFCDYHKKTEGKNTTAILPLEVDE